MSAPIDPSNPYLSPAAGPYGQPFTQASAHRSAPRLPTYCLVIFIMDLVFATLRAPLVLIGIVGLHMAAQGMIAEETGRMVFRTGLAEVLTSAGIVLFGIPANIGLLCKKPWGLILAWVVAAITVGSIGVGVWQLILMVQPIPEGSMERIAAGAGGLIAGTFRVVLLGLYVGALVVFARWSAAWASGLR